ncbi:PH domain-containing protein [Leifsonia sp. Root112D2]|uniref:PH domain-containing protein n=1 Tax=Leifsonia sp. Root112D2 TaxID=1736426 RepID=UPI0006FF3BAD|nr:PH domain-containing protein [Leifsonia sp. Root112D2]KQV07037.1 hypothetical protein ASC63_06795 [Leifsonia sp. Root112D2]
MTTPEGPVTGQPQELEARQPVAAQAERMADGEWHLLHPATPLLRGGIGFIAVLGIVIANLRERLTNMAIGLFGGNQGAPPNSNYDGDPIDQLVNHGLVGWALLALAVLLLLALGAFYLSWRMHSFRIGEDAVEVRSGILFRRHRKARLDRIQGVNVSRPLFARIFGTAKLEVGVAGQDANVELAYLGSALADELRRDILRRASGAHKASVPEPAERPATPDAVPSSATVSPTFTVRATETLNRRVNEFLAPELDPDAAPPESVVKISHVRLIGSIALHGFTIFLLIVVGLLIAGVASGRYWLLFAVLPGLLGSVGFYGRRFTKSVNYTIAGTADGVRVGFGLLSTSNETLPPGRIHAVEVMQPVLWRPFGWWQIRINTAGHSKQKGAAGQPNTTMLPVGDITDVVRVLELILPGFGTEEHRGLITAGMIARAGDEFTAAPRRAVWLRPFSWRRTGYTVSDGAVLLRSGAVWRRLVFVPLARLQSVEVSQGPVRRMLRLAIARLHTVDGPVHPRLSVVDAQESLVMFEHVAAEAIAAEGADTSHRWNSRAMEWGVPRQRAAGDDDGAASRQEGNA